MANRHVTHKATIVPLYFEPGRDEEFDVQLTRIGEMIGDLVELADPVALGRPIPDCDAVILPQILGEAYRRLDELKAVRVPILIVTTEFGTLAMWDWEIRSWLASSGVATIAPYTLEDTRKVCAALNVKKELRDTTFLIFQDNPGEGMQPSIFKRFYWWEKEATDRLESRFGLRVVRKSFRDFGSRAQSIPDDAAQAVLDAKSFPREGLSARALLSAIKVFMALLEEIDADPTIRGMGINCLNESHFSDTTPCLAWNLLFEERGIIWACEGDTYSLVTTHIVNRSLDAAIIMSNIYPFLMGGAALKHEKIPRFPDVDGNPDDHLLMAHCGYLGVCPQSFAVGACSGADERPAWTLRPKALSIVDENAHMIDARLPTGPCTLTKLGPMLDKLAVTEGELTGYVQYEHTDFLNGAVVKVPDGHRLMREVYSHHQCIMPGSMTRDLQVIAPIFGFEVVSIG